MNKIYNPLLKLIFLTGIFAVSFQSMGQVIPGDSIALVNLYNGTGGSSWTNHTNWLTGNVPTWYGVTVSGNRVTRVNLPSNNMVGSVTDSLRNLTSLIYLNFSSNLLTSFPALTGLHLDTLSLQNNKLTFKDLVPNRTLVDSFYYAPQDSVDVYEDTTVTEQSSITLAALVDYNPTVGDNYQWFLNGVSVASSGSNAYTIICMDSSFAGIYTSKITNNQLNKLTLYRRAIVLHVRKLANAGTSFAVCDSSTSLQGVMPAGGSVHWTVVSGSATIANDTMAVTAVSHLGVGPTVFNYAVSAGNISCGANTFSNAQITVTRDTNPSPAYAGLDQSTCTSQAFLNASPPSVGVGTWTVTRGSATITQPNTPVTAVNGLTTGQNIFRWQIVNGACAPSFYDEVIVFKDTTLTSVSAGKDTSICPTSYTLVSTLPANAHWTWSVVAGTGTFSSDTSTQTFLNDTVITTPVSGLAEFLNTFKWTVSNTCNSISANVNVTVYDFTIANAGRDTSLYFSPINGYTVADSVATASGGTGQYTYMWSPSTNLSSDSIAHPIFLTPDSGYYSYSVTVTDGHGCTASAGVNYHVVKQSFLVVPTLFTPNGDGLNDVLLIPDIESYPNNELIVADRNDQVVYRKSGYKNDWDGTNELGFSRTGEKLPADTYFYTLKLDNTKPVQTGFFLIKY